ncbi:hypothetical protein [Armatimonas sp.]|uniref:hypothetical protein n=1 Tax=Armatimonas sp. TaxID=1872638 RepID=UPI00374CB2CE
MPEDRRHDNPGRPLSQEPCPPCPKCQSEDVRPNGMDYSSMTMGRKLYQCRACKHRFREKSTRVEVLCDQLQKDVAQTEDTLDSLIVKLHALRQEEP